MKTNEYILTFTARPSPIPKKDLHLEDLSGASDILSLESGKSVDVVSAVVSSKGFAEISLKIKANSKEKAEKFECHTLGFDDVLELFSDSTSVSGWDMELCYPAEPSKSTSDSLNLDA